MAVEMKWMFHGTMYNISLPLYNAHGERLDYTYHPAKNPRINQSKNKSSQLPLIIMGHGLAGSKDTPIISFLATSLSDCGWPCLRISFSGNGLSDGNFIDSTISKEVGEVSSVIDQVGMGRKIIYLGYSMGATVGGFAVARDERIKLIISLSGMVETRAFIKRSLHHLVPDRDCIGNNKKFPLSSTLLDDLSQLDSLTHAVAELRIPWLCVHGTNDSVIPIEESRKLVSLLRGRPELVELPGENHPLIRGKENALKAVLTWLEKNG